MSDNEYYGKHRGKPSWIKELQKGPEFKRGWEDHLSYEDEYYFSEPYDVSKEDLEELTQFCEEYSLCCSVTGSSKHHPDCVLIKIWK